MANLNYLIQKYIDNEISLSLKDISASAKSREWFLNRIKNKINEKLDNGEIVPQLYSETQFVNFGSYFKGTKVKDVDEFDVLVVLDSNTGQFTQSGVVIGNGIGNRTPCHKYNRKFYKSDNSGVSPSKLINWLKGIVEEIVSNFGGEAPERAGQAITAIIKSQNLKIDLVPAGIFKHVETGYIFYNIPMGDAGNNWILTSPKEDIKLLSDYSKGRKNFKNIIRLIKDIKVNYNFNISSFAIECSVLRFAYINDWNDSLYTDFKNVLSDFSNKLREKRIIDTFDNKTNLISHLEVNEWYADRIDSIIGTMEELIYNFDNENSYTILNRKLRNE